MDVGRETKTEERPFLDAVRFLDGAMTESEVDRYRKDLRNDVTARDALNFVSRQALTCVEMTRATPGRRSLVANAEVKSRHWLMVAVAMAASFILGIVGYQFRQPEFTFSGPAIVTVSQMDGDASWYGEDGRLVEISKPSVELPAGSLMLDNEESWIEISFRDGTRLTLRGPSELNYSDDGQKLLHLRRGKLSAAVVPQPKDMPMIIRTPAAETTVLGTRFELDALSHRTVLAVEEGRVKMQRLIDGAILEVGEQKMAVADLSRDAQIESRKRPELSDRWQADFSQPANSDLMGEWLPANDDAPSRVATAPIWSKKLGKIQHRLVGKASLGPLVRLSPTTIARGRFRAPSDQKIEFFICTTDRDGRFAGNFALDFHAGNFPAGNDGWRTLDVDFSQLQPLVPKFPRLRADSRIQFFYFSTRGQASGLEFSTLEIVTP